jgi:predicted NUDIX family phosphoesterase
MTELKHMPKKMRPFIVAVHAEHFTDSLHGLSDYKLKTEDLVIANRGMLEEDDRYRQLLPNFVLLHNGKVWAYRRAPSGTEKRLHGLCAVSVGGHWDMGDMVVNESEIDLTASFEQAIERELKEEVNIQCNITHSAPMEKVIAASDTPVDRKHVGIVYFLELDGDNINSNEDDLDSLGFMDPQELLSSPDYPLETWARIICEQLVKK